MPRPGYLLIQGDSRLIPLKDKSVHVVITSPPYWGLRDYGTAAWEGGDDPGCDHKRPGPQDKSAATPRDGHKDGFRHGVESTDHAQEPYLSLCRKCGARRIDRQIGLEPSLEAFVATMVRVFREVRRVLRDDGTVWLNLGDSYAGGMIGRNDTSDEFVSNSLRLGRSNGPKAKNRPVPPGLKPKDLIGIPWRTALALQQDGWTLRSEITWCKTSPMPESCGDRPTSATEKLFLLTKRPIYYYDQESVRQPLAKGSTERYATPFVDIKTGTTGPRETRSVRDGKPVYLEAPSGRNLWNYWVLGAESYPGAHFATYPRKLVEPCVKAGSSERGCCPAMIERDGELVQCGAPWVRQVERGELVPTRQQYDKRVYGVVRESPDANDQGSNRARDGHRANMRYETKELGWSPSCSCPPHDPIPCTIFDPFCGSATTLVVANALGRHGIGMDLSREYLVNQAQRRLERPHAKPHRSARVEPALPLFPSAHEEE